MKFKAPSQSLTMKILSALALVMAVFFGGTLYYATNRTETELDNLQKSYSDHMAGFIGQVLRLAMETKDMTMLKTVLAESSGVHGIKAINIVNPNGVILYSSDPARVQTALTQTLELKTFADSKVHQGLASNRDGNENFIAVPLRVDKRCVNCHKTMGAYLGSIMIDHDLTLESERISSLKQSTFSFFFIALAVTITCLILLVRALVLSPLKSVLDEASKIAMGDLTGKVEVKNHDEMGQLSEALGAMQNHLRTTIDGSSAVAHSINDTVLDLDGSSEDLVKVAMDQSSSAAEQAASVHQVSSTAQEIAATSSQISNNVENIRATAEETFNACIRGRDDVKNVVSGMEEVKDQVRAIADSTVELGRKSQKIGGIISIIDEISEQTHLLALNAAIEAAGAGEHGKRFAVVAGEVRRLAERTVQATSEIKELIDEIQDSTNETVMITERGAAIVLEGASKVDLIGDSLENLLTMVMRTKDAAKEMAVATRQQALAGEQLVVTISDINGVAMQVSRSAELVEKSALRLKNIAYTLKELSSRNEAYTKFKT